MGGRSARCADQRKQHARRVVFQRPSEKERPELLAVARAQGSPPEPVEHPHPVITPGAALPADVCSQQPQHILVGEPKMLSQAANHSLRATARIIGYPAQPRQSTELHCGTEPDLGPHRRAKPTQVVAGQGEAGDQVLVGDLVRPSYPAPRAQRRTGTGPAGGTPSATINAVQDLYFNLRRPSARILHWVTRSLAWWSVRGGQ